MPPLVVTRDKKKKVFFILFLFFGRRSLSFPPFFESLPDYNDIESLWLLLTPRRRFIPPRAADQFCGCCMKGEKEEGKIVPPHPFPIESRRRWVGCVWGRPMPVKKSRREKRFCALKSNNESMTRARPGSNDYRMDFFSFWGVVWAVW